jgi:hypothetical protein
MESSVAMTVPMANLFPPNDPAQALLSNNIVAVVVTVLVVVVVVATMIDQS